MMGTAILGRSRRPIYAAKSVRNHNLEEQAQALYKSWFVDFEPFKDGKFVESELGMIPEGWRVGKICDLATLSSGKRPKTKHTCKSIDYSIPVIGASGVMAYTNEALYYKDILVAGRVGTLGIVQRFSIPCWPSDNTLLIDSQFKSFMHRALNEIDYSSLNRGSTQPLLTQGDLANVPLIIPCEEVLSHFEYILETYQRRQDMIASENNQLRGIINSTLPRLMSGELNS